MKKYDHKKIESKWQKDWARKKIYLSKEDVKKPKSYVLDMFPYPSGEGLHVGHPKGYIATDVYSRFKRMNGANVLHPMGWDAFGLPAENYAIKNKVHPKAAVDKNIKRYKEQLSIIGFNYDWTREINTTDPAYYKWTQWIFLKLLERGLAYQSHEPINWCPSCQTGLANEDLEDGKCERCGSVVEKKPMRQWVLKITDYAERLLSDLDGLNWPESVKESQRNWIGKSEGAEIGFEVQGAASKKIYVFTTRPDTIFGATALVLSPEHSWLTSILASKDILSNADAVRAYVRESGKRTEIDRTSAQKDKTGVKLDGVWAINPASKEKIPVFVADYVLAGHGTGAVMSVPAHDERDFAFAKKFGLDIRQVIEPTFEQTTEPGKIKEGQPFDHREAIIAIVKHWSEEKYIALKWKQVAWCTFITGGIESGQTPEEAAKMEIEQETGYLSAKFIKNFGIVHGKFYHVPKKTNRNAHARVVYFELQDESRAQVSDAEKEIHDILWLTADELKKQLTPSTHLHGLGFLLGENGPYTGPGTLSNSGQFNRLESAEVKEKITEFVGGKMVTKYKLRDWVFSRQRYWGEPIPVIHCEKCGFVPVPEKDLPVKLPNVRQYAPTGTGESPLADISKWVNVKCPKCRSKAKRETNTMPQWAGSSWYYLRYMDPKNKKALVDPKKEKYWAPVDVYVGGAEHATRHLIYARFWHKFLHDIGAVSTNEPFARLHNVGLILAEDGRKMSKRFGNVINPDDIVNTYGADTFRIYEMFMGPFGQASAWDTKSIMGSRRLIERIVRISEKVAPTKNAPIAPNSKEFESIFHKTIAKVGSDIESFSFNTAISSLMILTREFEEKEIVARTDFEILLKLIAPFAPHIADELWHELGNKKSIHVSDWPAHDPQKITSESLKIAVQVNGKVRAELEVSSSATEEEIKTEASKLDVVKKWLNGAIPKRVIYVKGRLVNFVME
jgi:leucyl-tRNA synthetase